MTSPVYLLCCVMLVLAVTECVTSACVVNNTPWQCVNPGHCDVTLLEHLDDTYESVLFTGNALDSLDSSLFGNRTMHCLLHLDLSDNSITRVSSDTFQSLRHLLNLTMRHNSWRTNTTVHRVFSPLTSLTHLDLQAAFLSQYVDAETNSSMYHVTSLSSLFADSKLTSLQTLHLENNGLLKCPTDMFRSMTSLRELWLSGNGLTGLDFDHRLLPSLQALHADNNAIRFLSSDVIVSFVIMNFNQSLKLVNISNNPFECSCYSKMFIKWVQWNISNSFLADRHELQCQWPRTEPILAVDLQRLDAAPCRIAVDSLYRATHVIIGLLFGSTVVFTVICFMLRNRSSAKETHNQYSPVRHSQHSL